MQLTNELLRIISAVVFTFLFLGVFVLAVEIIMQLANYCEALV